MNEVSMRPWGRVHDRDLMRWAGGRLLAIGRAIVKGGRLRDLVRTVAGEAFATVADIAAGREFFAGVAMQVEGKRRQFHCLCSCERARCGHAAAVALALRDAV